MHKTSSSPLLLTAERLSRAEIFRGLPDKDLIAMAEYCQEENHLENHILLLEGEPAEKLYVIERGKVALEKKIQIGRHSTPRNATIGYVVPGKIAGFSTLTLPYVYATSAMCVEPTRVIAIDGDPLRDYLQSHPQAGFIVMSNLTTLIASRYRKANNTLTFFLSIVSHELRSPLAAIENYLQLMNDGFTGEMNPKQNRMVKRSLLRILDLRALIGDVVDLARMRPEQIQADFEWFNPGEVGSESIEDAQLAAAEKDIRTIVEPPPKFEPIVGARRRIRQVFTNLLNNAIKFAPEGSKVMFRARYTPQEVIFEVEDSGSGIPPDEIENIFVDFYRASNVGETTGAGLGLAIAKKIVDAHNGSISITNLSGEDGETGACFSVVLPRDLTTPEMRRQEWIETDSNRD